MDFMDAMKRLSDVFINNPHLNMNAYEETFNIYIILERPLHLSIEIFSFKLLRLSSEITEVLHIT